jgi:hypothetical protein
MQQHPQRGLGVRRAESSCWRQLCVGGTVAGRRLSLLHQLVAWLEGLTGSERKTPSTENSLTITHDVYGLPFSPGMM